MDSLTERLHHLMHQNNMKATELAKAASVNSSTISRILKGTQIPASDTLYKLAKYFNVSMEYLLTGETASQNCAYANLLPLDNKLLQYFHGMSEEDQNELILIAQMKYSKRKKGLPAKSSLSGKSSPPSETA